MDGLLIVDKPQGPTSHDVVARVRRATGERRVGHTGTLDPAASGVLPMVLGRATRLARFLSASDKSYDAVIRLGVATDTYDAEGVPVGARHDGPLPSTDEIDRALESMRGTFLQQPPRYSAKKIDGTRSYKLARAGVPAEWSGTRAPEPVSVTARAIDILDRDGELVTVRIECSAGFYIRSLAHDLGRQLGVGGHLVGLRRTRSGNLAIEDAVPLEDLERALADDPTGASCWLIPLSGMLSHLPAVVLSEEETLLAAHGRDVGQRAPSSAKAQASGGYVRLLDPGGQLVGIGEPAGAPGLLHPSVVLG